MENQRYWRYLRCSNCNNVESIAGPLKSEMDWHDFAALIRGSHEMNPHYKYCSNCKKISHTVLISYDAE